MKEWQRHSLIIFAIIVFLAINFMPLDFSAQAKSVLAITAVAMILWVSEVIPLHATALLVALLLVVFGGFSAEKVFAQFFDKVVVLVLGGFVLAVALSKHKLDEYIAYKTLGKLGKKPQNILLGMLAVTAFLSMWMSNSASAAIAMPIALVIIMQNKLKPFESKFAKSMVLAVAYGATIGGIGTIIGSTPNVLAQKFLTEQGVQFGFVEWLVRGFPFMIALILISWVVLKKIFKPELNSIEVPTHTHAFTAEQKKVALIFLLTVGLWITESIHGIHNSIIALVPIILLYAFKLVNTSDFHKISWGTLILIGGGIAIGMAIDQSNIDSNLTGFLGSILSNHPLITIILLLGVVGIMLTSFLSNTAASAVLIPIITSLSITLGIDMTNLVVAGAIGVSMDFMLPMGTPPSALACSSGYANSKDLLKAGIIISILGAVLLALFSLIW